MYNMKNIDIEPHIIKSRLILYKGMDKAVKLYRFVGDIESDAFEKVKDYFYYITPDFALNRMLIGFDGYDDIGYYCQENDVWIVEEILDVPFELTVAYEKRALIDERDRRERSYYNYIRKQKESIAKIDDAFIDATYPNRKHDHLLDMINTSRVYVPEDRNFFSEFGVMYVIREDGDYMARISNSQFDNDLCNTRGLVHGVFCYTKYRSGIAKLINEVCSDETEEFRILYSKKRSFKGIPDHEPPMPVCPKCHKYHKPHVDCKYAKEGLY